MHMHKKLNGFLMFLEVSLGIKKKKGQKKNKLLTFLIFINLP